VTTSAREALIAEALGEMAVLLDRLEAVKPALVTACQDLTKAGEALASKGTNAEGHLAAFAEGAAARAVKHVARRTDELVKVAGEKEIRAMQAVIRELVQGELSQALQRLASSRRPPAFPWRTHAATAITVASLTWALAASVFMH